MMTSAQAAQIHPLFAFGAAVSAAVANNNNSSLGVSLAPTTSSSNNSTNGNNNAISSTLQIPTSMAQAIENLKSMEANLSNMKSSGSIMDIDEEDEISPPPSPSPCPSPTLQMNSAVQMSLSQQQQQLLGRLASGLSSAVNSQQQQQQQQQPNAAASVLSAAASKLMEMNPMDDLVMSEVTQRLLKMNQDLWQQQQVVANAQAVAGQVQQAQQQAQQQQQQQQQVNEMKLAEKLVNELAVQQSSRNAFHLNDRTLQECWTALQRVSCMIFMHKSAMQLQQQQAAAQQAQSQHHHLMRPGSSNSGSESGLSKPHQCQQCLKAFSSNHQLVQHIRVHTGEKPYKCSYCDRRFKQLSHVQQHTRLHTGERPYKCHVSDCGRAFIQLSNLQQHLRNHDAQLERSKNRPFHCNICGKGFATESSLRTHNQKVCKNEQHSALIGGPGPNAITCPICHKLFFGGDVLMEHMKHTHKAKRRTANHPCPVCGKHYVNEGSLRKHLAVHPETAQLSTSLRMWPCSVCQAVFTHESGLLTHMEQMRMDPKHQFAAQYVLSRAAAERREREQNILAAAAISAMSGHPFGSSHQGQLGGLLPMPPSPSGSDSSGRLSSPLDTNSGISQHSSAMHHANRMSMSSPVNGPLDARIHSNNNNNNNNGSSGDNGVGESGGNINGGMSRKEYENSLLENNNTRDSHNVHSSSLHHSSSHNLSSHHHLLNNSSEIIQNPKVQEAMKMASMLGQTHSNHHSLGHNNNNNNNSTSSNSASLSQQGHLGGHVPNDIRNLIHNLPQSQQPLIGNHNSSSNTSNEMMNSVDHSNMRIQAEALLMRSQAAEALRIAVANNLDSHNNTSNSNNNNNNNRHNSNNSSSSPTNSNRMDTSSSGMNGILGNQQQGLERGSGGLDHGSITMNQINSMLSQHHPQQLPQQSHHHPHDLLRVNPSLEIRMSSGGGGMHSHSIHNGGSSSGRSSGGSNGMDIQQLQNGHHHHHLGHHHQLNSLLGQQSELSEALLRLERGTLGFPLPAHNS